MMTHTKREPRARPRKPFLCRKTILESIKSFSISDWNKISMLPCAPTFFLCLSVDIFIICNLNLIKNNKNTYYTMYFENFLPNKYSVYISPPLCYWLHVACRQWGGHRSPSLIYPATQLELGSFKIPTSCKKKHQTFFHEIKMWPNFHEAITP